MNLFAYGTLMWPEVLESVTGIRCIGKPATLKGYKRLRVIGEDYPVVIPSLEDSVEGVLYRSLSATAFNALDRFEGAEYDRVETAVEEEAAFVYVLSNDWKHIADLRIWTPEQMTPERLSAFCTEYKGWIER